MHASLHAQPARPDRSSDGDPETSTSAHIRNLRSPQFDGYTVQKRRRTVLGGASNGAFRQRDMLSESLNPLF